MVTSRKWRHAALALVVYVLLTVVQGRLVLQHAADHLPSDAGDPVLNLAILTWTSGRVPLTEEWWDFPGFHPIPRALTLSEHLTGLNLLAAPALFFVDRPVLVYNILFLLSFAASAMAAYALAYSLTGRADAAFLAGLVFGFAPYRTAHLSHIQLLSAYWMPVALLALHRHVATERLRWAALAAAAWLLQTLTNSYALVLFSVVVGLWVIWFAVLPRRWRSLLAIGAVFLVAVSATVPLIRQYTITHGALGLRRDILEITGFSADVLSLANATSRLSLWGSIQFFGRPEGELFPGIALPILLAFAGTALWRRRALVQEADSRRLRRLRQLLLGGAIGAVAAALSVQVFGPWAFEIGGLRVSASHIDKPLTLALAMLVAAVGLGHTWRAAMRGTSALAFYAGAAVVTWLLALGPSPRLGGVPVLYDSPYRWLLSFPGVEHLRVPARFWLMTVLCLSIVAAMLFARATARTGLARRRALTAIAAAGLIADGWMTIPIVTAPERIAGLDEHAPGSNVIEVPLGDLVADAAAQYRAARGGWRTFNGYSGYSPPHYPALRQALDTQPDEAIQILRGYGTMTVSVDTARDADGRWLALIRGESGNTPVASGNGRFIFRLPGVMPSNAVRAPEQAPTIASVTSACNPESTPLLIDGDVTSWWECAQMPGDLELLIALAEESLVGAVTEFSGRRAGDPAADLEIDTSPDGFDWEPAWSGPIAAAALAGSLAEPARNPVRVQFAPRSARFVRLRQRGWSQDYRWWIAELQVNAPL